MSFKKVTLVEKEELPKESWLDYLYNIACSEVESFYYIRQQQLKELLKNRVFNKRELSEYKFGALELDLDSESDDISEEVIEGKYNPLEICEYLLTNKIPHDSKLYYEYWSSLKDVFNMKYRFDAKEIEHSLNIAGEIYHHEFDGMHEGGFLPIFSIENTISKIYFLNATPLDSNFVVLHTKKDYDFSNWESKTPFSESFVSKLVTRLPKELSNNLDNDQLSMIFIDNSYDLHALCTEILNDKV